MNRRILFCALLLVSILAILAVLWFLPRGRDAWRGMMDNPSNDEGVIPAVEQTPSQVEETPAATLPENVVLDPESGQYVLYNELTILASGENVEAIVAEFKGEIVLHVKETDTYQVRFR